MIFSRKFPKHDVRAGAFSSFFLGTWGLVYLLAWQERLGSAWFLKTLGPGTPFWPGRRRSRRVESSWRRAYFLCEFHQALGKEHFDEIFPFYFDKPDSAMRSKKAE